MQPSDGWGVRGRAAPRMPVPLAGIVERTAAAAACAVYPRLRPLGPARPGGPGRPSGNTPPKVGLAVPMLVNSTDAEWDAGPRLAPAASRSSPPRASWHCLTSDSRARTTLGLPSVRPSVRFRTANGSCVLLADAIVTQASHDTAVSAGKQGRRPARPQISQSHSRKCPSPLSCRTAAGGTGGSPLLQVRGPSLLSMHAANCERTRRELSTGRVPAARPAPGTAASCAGS